MDKASAVLVLGLLGGLGFSSSAQAGSCETCVRELWCNIDECYIVERCKLISLSGKLNCEVDLYGCISWGSGCQWAGLGLDGPASPTLELVSTDGESQATCTS